MGYLVGVLCIAHGFIVGEIDLRIGTYGRVGHGYVDNRSEVDACKLVFILEAVAEARQNVREYLQVASMVAGDREEQIILMQYKAPILKRLEIAHSPTVQYNVLTVLPLDCFSHRCFFEY